MNVGQQPLSDLTPDTQPCSYVIHHRAASGGMFAGSGTIVFSNEAP